MIPHSNSDFNMYQTYSDKNIIQNPLVELSQLRQKLAIYEEELFDLRATIPTIEIEAKYEAEKGIKNLQSELTFKNQESLSLKQENSNLIRDLENLKNKLKTIETNTKSTELSQINGNKKNDTKEKLGEFSDHPHLSLIKKKKIYETTNLISNQLSNVVTNLNSLASSLYLSSAITHKDFQFVSEITNDINKNRNCRSSNADLKMNPDEIDEMNDKIELENISNDHTLFVELFYALISKFSLLFEQTLKERSQAENPSRYVPVYPLLHIVIDLCSEILRMTSYRKQLSSNLMKGNTTNRRVKANDSLNWGKKYLSSHSYFAASDISKQGEEPLIPALLLLKNVIEMLSPTEIKESVRYDQSVNPENLSHPPEYYKVLLDDSNINQDIVKHQNMKITHFTPSKRMKKSTLLNVDTVTSTSITNSSSNDATERIKNNNVEINKSNNNNNIEPSLNILCRSLNPVPHDKIMSDGSKLKIDENLLSKWSFLNAKVSDNIYFNKINSEGSANTIVKNILRLSNKITLYLNHHQDRMSSLASLTIQNIVANIVILLLSGIDGVSLVHNFEIMNILLNDSEDELNNKNKHEGMDVEAEFSNKRQKIEMNDYSEMKTQSSHTSEDSIFSFFNPSELRLTKSSILNLIIGSGSIRYIMNQLNNYTSDKYFMESIKTKTSLLKILQSLLMNKRLFGIFSHAQFFTDSEDDSGYQTVRSSSSNVGHNDNNNKHQTEIDMNKSNMSSILNKSNLIKLDESSSILPKSFCGLLVRYLIDLKYTTDSAILAYSLQIILFLNSILSNYQSKGFDVILSSRLVEDKKCEGEGEGDNTKMDIANIQHNLDEIDIFIMPELTQLWIDLSKRLNDIPNYSESNFESICNHNLHNLYFYNQSIQNQDDKIKWKLTSEIVFNLTVFLNYTAQYVTSEYWNSLIGKKKELIHTFLWTWSAGHRHSSLRTCDEFTQAIDTAVVKSD